MDRPVNPHINSYVEVGKIGPHGCYSLTHNPLGGHIVHHPQQPLLEPPYPPSQILGLSD